MKEDWEPSQETRAFHPQLAAAMEIKRKSSGPVDQRKTKLTEEEFLDKINPQLDVMVEMQAGAHEVTEARGAAVLRHLDTEKLRTLLKRNYVQGPGGQGDEFFAAQTSLDEAKASNKRMQEEGAGRAKVLKPVADTIDTWGPQLRAALEMNVFNPETPLRDMEVDEIDALKERYLNTKFLLNQSRNPFPASLLQELPTLAAQHREVQGRGMPPTGAFGPEEQSPEAILGVPAGTVEFQILRLKRLIELHMGEQRMIGGKWKRERGPLNAPAWAKPLPEAERMMLEMRTHPRTFRSAFFEPIAQIAMGDRPRLEHIVGPFHAKDDDEGYHWRKEVQAWDLVSLFSTFGHRHLYAVWSHLPITLAAHKRGAKNATTNNQRRDDFRQIQKEAKDFVLLHDLPVPTTDLEWKQLYREMGSFFAAKVFLSRTPQVVMDLPVADIHDSKEHLRFRAVCDERITLPLKAFSDFPEIYNNLSASLGQQGVVEVKMAWRCNTEQWWTARLRPEYAGPIYRKLGYAESFIKGLGLGDLDTSAAFGAERIILDPSAAEQERSLPPITPDNVSSVASDDYKRKVARDKTAHVFWARMECGLVLSSVSSWEIADKKKGETKGGYVCRHCRGFWRGGRFLMITGSTRASPRSSSSSWTSPPSTSTRPGSRTASSSTSVWSPRLPLATAPSGSTRTSALASGSARNGHRFGPDLVRGPLQPGEGRLEEDP